MLLIKNIEYSKNPVRAGETFIIKVSIEEIIMEWSDGLEKTWNDFSNITWEDLKYKNYI